MNRAYVIKGPLHTSAVLFAEKSPAMKDLRNMEFQTNRQIHVEQVSLVDGHPLKGKHEKPTLYVFGGSNGQQEVSVGTQYPSGKWNLSSRSNEFASLVPAVENLLKSCISK